MNQDWNTKYGTRRVRRDPPTLEEAIFAAVGITDDQEAQAEIAASLMGLPIESVQAVGTHLNVVRARLILPPVYAMTPHGLPLPSAVAMPPPLRR